MLGNLIKVPSLDAPSTLFLFLQYPVLTPTLMFIAVGDRGDFGTHRQQWHDVISQFDWTFNDLFL